MPIKVREDFQDILTLHQTIITNMETQKIRSDQLLDKYQDELDEELKIPSNRFLAWSRIAMPFAESVKTSQILDYEIIKGYTTFIKELVKYESQYLLSVDNVRELEDNFDRVQEIVFKLEKKMVDMKKQMTALPEEDEEDDVVDTEDVVDTDILKETPDEAAPEHKMALKEEGPQPGDENDIETKQALFAKMQRQDQVRMIIIEWLQNNEIRNFNTRELTNILVSSTIVKTPESRTIYRVIEKMIADKLIKKIGGRRYRVNLKKIGEEIIGLRGTVREFVTSLVRKDKQKEPILKIVSEETQEPEPEPDQKPESKNGQKIDESDTNMSNIEKK